MKRSELEYAKLLSLLFLMLMQFYGLYLVIEYSVISGLLVTLSCRLCYHFISKDDSDE